MLTGIYFEADIVIMPKGSKENRFVIDKNKDPAGREKFTERIKWNF